MVRLADYVGVDDYLKAAAKWLDEGVHSILNKSSEGATKGPGGL